MARGVDMARKATWQSHASPRGEPRWPEWTQTRGMGHVSPCGCPRGRHVTSEGAGILRAHGLVGPG